MKRPTTAKTFALSSYSEDIFDGFSSTRKPYNSNPKPMSAKSRTHVPSKKDTQEIFKTSSLINDSDIYEDSLRKNRPSVPHDYQGRNQHYEYCRSFKSSTITDAIAYHPRQKGLYGKSNRISHLRSVLEQNLEYAHPIYPPSSFRRTIGGSNSPADHFLRRKSIHADQNNNEQVPKLMCNTNEPSQDRKTSTNNDTASFYDILHIKRSNYDPINRKLENNYEAASLKIPTRYSSNKEWYRQTNFLIQPIQNSAS